MTGAVLSPILPQIKSAYPSISTIWIESLVTIPSLFVIALLPLINKLKISSRKQALIGLFIYSIGGLIPLIFLSFKALIVSRSLSGVALALIAGPAISLITSNYSESTQQEFLGYASAVTNIGTVSSVLFAGFVAPISWRLTFLVYSFWGVLFYFYYFLFLKMK
ncbi:MFS transporter [Furfurilactobacillus sp. WILCCON 0119]